MSCRRNATEEESGFTIRDGWFIGPFGSWRSNDSQRNCPVGRISNLAPRIQRRWDAMGTRLPFNVQSREPHLVTT